MRQSAPRPRSRTRNEEAAGPCVPVRLHPSPRTICNSACAAIFTPSIAAHKMPKSMSQFAVTFDKKQVMGPLGQSKKHKAPGARNASDSFAQGINRCFPGQLHSSQILCFLRLRRRKEERIFTPAPDAPGSSLIGRIFLRRMGMRAAPGARNPAELDLLRQIRRRTRSGGPVILGIGDDCALLRARPGEEIAVTTDLN